MLIPVNLLGSAEARKVFDIACAEARECGLLLCNWDESLAAELQHYFEKGPHPFTR